MNSIPVCRFYSSIRFITAVSLLMICCFSGLCGNVAAGDAPQWMHALINAAIPEHDGKTDAVLLFSERIVNVESETKIKTEVRKAYRILRPDGRRYAYVAVPTYPGLRITGMHGWSISAQGQEYEVKEKDAAEISLPDIDGSELVTDVKSKVIRIPAAEPGAILGYEYQQEEQPYVLQDHWPFQQAVPVRETHYILRLPKGWTYKTTFLNSAEVSPTLSGDLVRWSFTGVKALKSEENMPAWDGIASQMIIAYAPAGSTNVRKSFNDWRGMAAWYTELLQGRTESSPEIQQKVQSLISGAPDTLGRIRGIAWFVQNTIRYVAIELGVGGWRPHTAAEVLSHLYGDCKDKVALMQAMLRQMGVESHYVLINSERGSVTPQTQAHLGAFDHAIIAVRLPSDAHDDSLTAVREDPNLGRLVFFDPTNEFVPFGRIGGYLQDNYGLIVTAGGGELVKLPLQPGATNGRIRTARLTLSPQGALSGDFDETLSGDRAWQHRSALRSARQDADRIKPIEKLLSQALPSFQITKAVAANVDDEIKPFQYRYSIVVPGYAKSAGNLVVVRPRVVGTQASAILEKSEARSLPVEFECLSSDSDTFEISLPSGYVADDLPPPVNMDYSFASYHSKTETDGRVLRYSRTMEIKQLTVPLDKIGELKMLYRAIASDEKNNAVLRPAAPEQK
jgi:hypothetical protein